MDGGHGHTSRAARCAESQTERSMICMIRYVVHMRRERERERGRDEVSYFFRLSVCRNETELCCESVGYFWGPYRDLRSFRVGGAGGSPRLTYSPLSRCVTLALG